MIPDGLSYEESEAKWAVFFAKWRQESTSGSEFEARFVGCKNSAEVFQADYAIGEDGRFALKLFLRLDDETYPEIFLRSEGLEISRSDGEVLSIAQFTSLGDAYWEAFAAKGRALRAAQHRSPEI